MYEIWLMLNILWEIALGAWPLLLAAAVLWVSVLAVALRRPGRGWRAGLPYALAVGVATTVLATLLVPGWTRSSLSNVNYAVDWISLLALAAGFGAVALLFAWPLAAMFPTEESA